MESDAVGYKRYQWSSGLSPDRCEWIGWWLGPCLLGDLISFSTEQLLEFESFGLNLEAASQQLLVHWPSLPHLLDSKYELSHQQAGLG